jgi:peptidoglycan/LPS O-acetylase OafA/YrhL
MLRIFPAFYSYLAVASILTLMKVLPLRPSWLITAATFTWNYGQYWIRDNSQYQRYLSHFWTLSLEEQFYLVWPVTFVLLKQKRAAFLSALILLLLPFVRIASYYLDPGSRGQIQMMLHTGGDILMFGCLLAILHGSRSFERVWDRINHWSVPATCATLIFVAWPFVLKMDRHLWLPLGNTLTGIAVAIMVYWVIRNPASLAARILESKPLVWIGTLSYSLYVWQEFFLCERNSTWSGEFPANLICSVAAAVASYYLIEKPFLRLRSRYRY